MASDNDIMVQLQRNDFTDQEARRVYLAVEWWNTTIMRKPTEAPLPRTDGTVKTIQYDFGQRTKNINLRGTIKAQTDPEVKTANQMYLKVEDVVESYYYKGKLKLVLDDSEGGSEIEYNGYVKNYNVIKNSGDEEQYTFTMVFATGEDI